MEEPKWKQISVGLAVAVFGTPLTFFDGPYDWLGSLLVIGGVVLMAIGLLPSIRTSTWYLKWQEMRRQSWRALLRNTPPGTVDDRLHIEKKKFKDLSGLMSKSIRYHTRAQEDFVRYTRLPHEETEYGRLNRAHVWRKSRLLRKVWRNVRKARRSSDLFEQKATRAGRGLLAKAGMMENMDKLRLLRSSSAKLEKVYFVFAEAHSKLQEAIVEARGYSKELDVVGNELIASLSAVSEGAMVLSRYAERANRIACEKLAGDSSSTPPADPHSPKSGS